MKVRLVITSAALAGAIAIAGCGSSSSGGEGNAAIVSVGSVPEVGRVIVSSKGFTLYEFRNDKGTQSTCYGFCAKTWPPLTTSGSPRAVKGAVASKLGTTERKNGTTQVTYAGHPLYTFTGDSEPGQRVGNGIEWGGAEWYALKPSGKDAEYNF